MTTTLYGKQVSLAPKKESTSSANKIFGFGYPIQKEPKKGYFFKQSGVDLVKNNLRQLLMTRKGERVMLPEYGINLHEYLFEPLDKFLFEQIREEILYTLNKFAPGIDVLRLSILNSGNVNLEGVQGILIILVVKIKELNDQLVDIKVEIG